MYEKEVAEIEDLIQTQADWRNRCINLIASENALSQRVRAQAGSDFAHRYAAKGIPENGITGEPPISMKLRIS